MAGAPIAKRYARALFALAEEAGRQEAWLESLVRIRDRLDPAATRFFGEPRVPAERKAAAAAQLAADADPLVANLVGLLVRRRAIGSLGAIVDAYGAVLDERLGRTRATVTSAAALAPGQRARLEASLSGLLEREVVIEERRDPAVIAGVVVRVGDRIMDGSVRARLDGLRQRLERESPAETTSGE